MIRSIQQLFSTPNFGDLEEARAARLLHLSIWIAFSVSFIYLPIALFWVETSPILIAGLVLFTIGAPISLWALARGYVQPVKVYYLTTIWIILSLGTYFSGGINSVTFPGFIVYILIGGLLIGWRASMVLALLSALSGGVVLFLQLQGLIPPYSIPLHIYFIVVMIFFFAIPTVGRGAISDLTQSRTIALTRMQELDIFFNQTSDAVFLIHLDGRFKSVNQGAAKMLGYSVEELERMRNEDVVANTDVHQSSSLLKRLQAGEELPLYERKLRKRDGDLITVEISSQLIRGEDNEPAYIQSMVRNISQRILNEQRRIAEEKFRLELEQEKEILELKNRFVTIASHNFRSPLSAIKLSADFLHTHDHKLPPEKRLAKLGQIDAEIQRMTTLINNVIVVSEGLSGELAIKPARVNLPAFVEVVSHSAREQLQNGRTLQIEACLTLEDAWFDEGAIFRVMKILFDNAKRYSAEDAEIICRFANDDQCLTFSVADRGLGIAADDLKRIFDPFHRASEVVNLEGSGLGLTIAKAYVDAHGGTIGVTSEVGQGSTFAVRLPIDEA